MTVKGTVRVAKQVKAGVAEFIDRTNRVIVTLLTWTDRFTCPRRMRDEPRNKDYWTVERRCSFCGSLHPNDAMKAIRGQIVELVGSDRPYRCGISFGTVEETLYFQHLAIAQKTEFASLLAAGRMKIRGGWFRVKPYFVVCCN